MFLIIVLIHKCKSQIPALTLWLSGDIFCCNVTFWMVKPCFMYVGCIICKPLLWPAPFFWKEPLVSLWSDSNKQTNTQVNSEENLFKCSKSRKSVNRTLEIIYPSFEMNGKRSTCHCGGFISCCKGKKKFKNYTCNILNGRFWSAANVNVATNLMLSKQGCFAKLSVTGAKVRVELTQENMAHRWSQPSFLKINKSCGLVRVYAFLCQRRCTPI